MSGGVPSRGVDEARQRAETLASHLSLPETMTPELYEEACNALLSLSARVAELEAALDDAFDTAMERWHESPPWVEPKEAAAWLGLTDERYAAWVERNWDKFFVAAALSVRAGASEEAEEEK